MFLLGLTGDIASGKSAVARMLMRRGAVHLDADELVHELYADAVFAAQLQAHLQRFRADRVLDITNENGAIHRRALGELVFADAPLLKHLEELVHPEVSRLRETKLEELRRLQTPPQVVVLEAVKLVESGQVRGCDGVWWISSSPEVQLQRLTKNRGWSAEQARARLSSQPSQKEKAKLLGSYAVPWVLILNDGSLEELEKRVETQWARLFIN